jgi:hypothetical protein
MIQSRCRIGITIPIDRLIDLMDTESTFFTFAGIIEDIFTVLMLGEVQEINLVSLDLVLL